MRRTLCSIAVSTLLAGCFGPDEPTSSEVDQTLKEYYDKMGKQWVELVKSEKISCVAAKDKPGFSCDVNITISRLSPRAMSSDTPKTLENPRIFNLRFVKTSKGWEIPDRF
ncbi:MAG: hypothetical protein K2P67_06605 [Gallionellaceae bacterium]|jgi:hypothetical protein|nr:hypothetical protein [Gallionellaceae bacterium]